MISAGRGPTVVHMSLPQRLRDRNPSRISSGLALADNALLVVGAVVVALVALKFLGFILGGVWFLVKLAAVAAAVYVVARMAMKKFGSS